MRGWSGSAVASLERPKLNWTGVGSPKDMGGRKGAREEPARGISRPRSLRPSPSPPPPPPHSCQIGLTERGSERGGGRNASTSVPFADGELTLDVAFERARSRPAVRRNCEAGAAAASRSRRHRSRRRRRLDKTFYGFGGNKRMPRAIRYASSATMVRVTSAVYGRAKGRFPLGPPEEELCLPSSSWPPPRIRR